MEISLDVDGNPLVDQLSEDGFVDLVFRIRELAETGDRYRFHMSASHEGQTLGLGVEVVRDMRPGFDSEMNLIKEHVYRPGVRFFRSGPESDRLLATMARLYELEQTPDRMVDVESFTAIVLQQGDMDMSSEAVRLKLFGRDGPDDGEDDYCESFFTVDLPNGLVFWSEKDPDYRAPLVGSLGGPAPSPSRSTP